MGQDQPKVIILTILVLLQYPMLHIKVQCNWSTSSREDFTMNRHDRHVGPVMTACDLDCLNKLFFPQPNETLYEICYNCSSGF